MERGKGFISLLEESICEEGKGQGIRGAVKEAAGAEQGTAGEDREEPGYLSSRKKSL